MNDIPPFSLNLYIAFHRLFCCFGWSSSFSCQIVFWVNYIIGFTFVFSSCYSFVPVCETCHQKSISAISYSEKLFLVPNLSVPRELVRKCQKKTWFHFAYMKLSNLHRPQYLQMVKLIIWVVLLFDEINKYSAIFVNIKLLLTEATIFNETC